MKKIRVFEAFAGYGSQAIVYHIFRTLFCEDQPENKNQGPIQQTLFDQ